MEQAPRRPLVRRSAPPVRAAYNDYREDLRVDFWHACAYCSITEAEASGLRFTIDHYEAKSKVPEKISAYDNLMWCCDACNARKGDDWPNPALIAVGLDLFRPDVHHPADHFALEGVDLRALTKVGECTHHLLDLNRAALRRLRTQRARATACSEEIRSGLRALAAFKLDDLPPEQRAKFARLRAELVAEAAHAEDSLAELVRILSRSHLLDPEPEAAARSRERRAWLRQQGALAPPADE